MLAKYFLTKKILSEIEEVFHGNFLKRGNNEFYH